MQTSHSNRQVRQVSGMLMTLASCESIILPCCNSVTNTRHSPSGAVQQHRLVTSTVLLALALRARLQDLITAMVFAAQHRTDTQFDHPVSLYEMARPCGA
jgi:hypothetical protein